MRSGEKAYRESVTSMVRIDAPVSPGCGPTSGSARSSALPMNPVAVVKNANPHVLVM